MNFTTDKLRSLVKKWQTLIEAHVDVKTTDNYMLRLFCIGFTKRRPNQVKRTCYAQSSQIRQVMLLSLSLVLKRLNPYVCLLSHCICVILCGQIRRKMVEIMVNQASSCDLKELVSKFIPEVIGKEIEKVTSGIFPLQNVFIRKVKILKAPKFDLGKLMEVISACRGLCWLNLLSVINSNSLNDFQVHGDYKEDVGVKLERPPEGDEAMETAEVAAE
jgi:small subunit ribosomal protein S3Ae